MVIKPESTIQSMNNILELRKEVEKINWWHKIDLGNGVITPGIDITPEKLKWIQMTRTKTTIICMLQFSESIMRI